MPDFPTHGDNFTTLGPVRNDLEKYRKASNTMRSSVMKKAWEIKRLRAELAKMKGKS